MIYYNEMDNNFSKLLSKANSLFKAGKYQCAIDVYLKLFSFKSNSFELCFNLSLSYFHLKDIDNSVKYVYTALNLRKDDIFLARHIYNLCISKPDDINLLIKFQEVVDLISDVDLCFKCVYLLKKINETNNSLYFLQKILEKEPNNLKALKEVASIYSLIDKEVAIQMCEELHKDFPSDKEVMDLSLNIYNKMLNYEKCIEFSNKLLKLDKNVFYYSILANSLMCLYRYNECEMLLDEAIKLYPDNAAIRILLADICSINNNKEKSYSLIEKYKNIPNFRKTYAVLRLSDKEIDEVRDEFYKMVTEFVSDEKIFNKAKKMFYDLNLKDRFNINENDFLSLRTKYSVVDTKLKEKVSEKLFFDVKCNFEKIFVIGINGAGDLLMSARYFHILQERNIKYSLFLNKSLYNLIKYNFQGIDIITSSEYIDNLEFDYVTSDLNLINFLKMDLKNIPFSSGYLNVSDDLVNVKSKLVDFDSNKLKVGLYWQGNPTILKNRSIKLEKLLPLFNDTKRQVFSFQISKDDFESENLKSTLNIVDLAPFIKNYEDTAAFLKNIDILVTVDTSIAHLAGALGVKTFLLLPFDAEWRWFNDTETTSWYDSVKIFKQGPDAQWDNVIERVNIELDNV